MSNVSFGDAARDQLRALVETIDQQITRLPSSGADQPSAAGLQASWGELVKALALGPTPETRQCPVCHGTGMRTASRCGHCWTKLEALEHAPPPSTHAAPATALHATDPTDAARSEA